MIAECQRYFDRTILISLDHDLNPQPGATEDPGTGLDVTNHLVNFPPICPVVIHSSNVERVWSMHNEFRFAGWEIDRIGPFDKDWIQTSWRRLVEPLIARRAKCFLTELRRLGTRSSTTSCLQVHGMNHWRSERLYCFTCNSVVAWATSTAFGSGRSAAWLARLLRVQEVVSSSLTVPTIPLRVGCNPKTHF